MTSNKSWGVNTMDSKYCYVMLYVSRNKDNKDVPDFKERRKAFICTEEKREYYIEQFQHFVNEGVTGEMSRLYVSVNKRDMNVVHKQLLHFLIDNPDFNLCSMNSKLAAIAAQKECAAEKSWLIDFDFQSVTQAEAIVKDISDIDKSVVCGKFPTPHGYAIICSHGFDSRELMNKWGGVATIKKDDLLCLSWMTK